MRAVHWSRNDDRVLEGLLIAAFALVTLFVVIRPMLVVLGVLDSAAGRVVPISRATIVPGIPSDSAMSITGTHEVELIIPHADLGQRFLLDVPGIAAGVLALLLLYLLIRIAHTLRNGEVFTAANVRRVRTIAFAIVLGGLLGPVVEAATTQLLIQGNSPADLIPFEFHISFIAVLAGLLIAALAEVFARGVRLRQDTEGLI